MQGEKAAAFLSTLFLLPQVVLYLLILLLISLCSAANSDFSELKEKETEKVGRLRAHVVAGRKQFLWLWRVQISH